VASAEEHTCALATSLDTQLSHEPALADARLTNHGDQPRLHGPGRLNGVPKLAKLDLPSDQGRFAGRRVRLGRRGLRRRWDDSDRRRDCWARRTLPEDVLVKRLRLGLGLRAQLALEDAHVDLVLAQRRPATAEVRIQTHQRAVHELL
jgi:hypothetical protein